MQIVRTRLVSLNAARPDIGTFDPTTDVVALAPGGALGRRAESPAGIVLVLEGSVLLERGSDLELGTAGMVMMMPAGSRQMLRNVGDPIARIIIYTPAPAIAARPTEHASDTTGAAAD
jgi:quercetin dioxygenase-like cupin family protein